MNTKKYILAFLTVSMLIFFSLVSLTKNENLPILETPVFSDKKFSQSSNISPKPLDTKTKDSSEIQKTNPLEYQENTISQTDPNIIYKNAASYSIAKKISNDLWLTQGDILVDSNDENLDKIESTLGVIDLKEVKYWQDKIIPYEINPDIKNQNDILQAIKEINQLESVSFQPKQDEHDYIEFISSKVSNCQSFLGRKGGKQGVTIGFDCTKGQILHELMHVLGFVHEQSRADRDNYINIHWENIEPEFLDQFQKIEKKISIPTPSELDYHSILMYPSNGFSINGKPTMTMKNGDMIKANRIKLSEQDEHKIVTLYSSF